ncbi:MAG: hypothetical protein ABIH82_03190 [Candidatus Woesearchaeota archaeon]
MVNVRLFPHHAVLLIEGGYNGGIAKMEQEEAGYDSQFIDFAVTYLERLEEDPNAKIEIVNKVIDDDLCTMCNFREGEVCIADEFDPEFERELREKYGLIKNVYTVRELLVRRT